MKVIFAVIPSLRFSFVESKVTSTLYVARLLDTDAVVDAVTKNATDVNVDISLEGDAKGIFKTVRTQNELYRKMTGRSALT